MINHLVEIPRNATGQTIAIWVQTAVLTVTAVLIWCYTKKTAKLADQSVRQNKLTLRPIVLPEFSSKDDPVRAFRLKNCGAGCAVNVRVLPIGTERFAGDALGLGMGRIESRVEPIAYLPSGDTVEAKVSTWADDQRLQGTPFHLWFHPVYPANQETEIVITFEDIEGGRYRLRAAIAAEENRANLPRTVTIMAIEEI